MTINEIREATKQTIINTMQEAIRQMFTSETHVMKAVMVEMECANELHDEYGMSWAEIEALEVI